MPRHDGTLSVIIYIREINKKSSILRKFRFPHYAFARQLSRIPSIERGCHAVEIRVDVTIHLGNSRSRTSDRGLSRKQELKTRAVARLRKTT